ncbi:MAG: MotA/TolQ/ExbB proton channel family protein [Bacteroidales bacterium]|nr:MotA/TolQ/ExbB proton channel family protein [Bacteroidales bacterium]MDE5743808.1 MotA/TolQ/ExbB proton channel family protein [Bacteroidales bacterium]MDE6514675.1 MotA/TolQ/ExbB proton channel family protein [Bacteroidales bacterium]MDE7090252.1 MotA/TolQ/ExbB proton channel family protein [Bacteroidales bacterium]MDE7103076.1 MotA/TolQ/ExbB proton channel family protein [Bacteroidales bacterium]
MKKLMGMLTIGAMFFFGASNWVMAQDEAPAAATQEETVAEATEDAVEATLEEGVEAATELAVESKTFHQALKEKFIQGGAGWMTPILLVLIIGLTLIIERIIYLNLSTTNTEKLLKSVEDALANGGIEAAKEVCRNTRGPVASIFYQGLLRADEGVEMMEKSVVSYGGVAMGRLEKNLSWIAFVIAIAPMLGFLGTVVGMVQAFDDIEAAGDISPTVVAGGMKVALLTTVFGLIVAIIVQTFYNYLSAKVDSLVNSMEDASISFMDIMVKFTSKR